MRALLPLAILALGVGCSSSATPVDAGGPDAFSPGIDAGTPTDAGPPDGGCDVGTPPSDLPTVVGAFAISDADGGSTVPVQTGGDPVGIWVFDRATFYVASAQAAMFDLETSTVDGTAWIEVTDTEFMLDWRFVTTLMGTIAGTIVRPSSTQIRAEYTLDGARFVPTPICASTAMTPTDGGTGGSAGLSFTQTGDAITMMSELRGASGMITIVLEGTRRDAR